MFSQLALSIMLSVQSVSPDPALVKAALRGNNDAIIEVAKQLSVPQSAFFMPDKALEMLLPLAKNGDFRTFSTLAKLFSYPMSTQYAPKRSLFYLKKVDDYSQSEYLWYAFISGEYHISLDDIWGLGSDDYYRPLLNIFKDYPFKSLSPSQIADIKKMSEHPSTTPYQAYIIPVLLTPVLGGVHLYEQSSVQDSAMWHFDEVQELYQPLGDTKGVSFIKYKPSSSSKDNLVLYYPPNRLKSIKDYYSQFLKAIKIRNGATFKAPGLNITVKRDRDYAYVIFEYEVTSPLIQHNTNHRL